MRTRAIILIIVLLLAGPASAGLSLDAGGDSRLVRERNRSIAGDLCDTAESLPRGTTVSVDLCQAWNDYDPGAFGCSPCELPGPDVVYKLDTQAGEQLRIAVSAAGDVDVRLYLATDCHDPVGSCLVASQDSAEPLVHTLAQGGMLYLFVDTTDECGAVSVTLEGAANTARSTWGALKAIYR